MTDAVALSGVPQMIQPPQPADQCVRTRTNQVHHLREGIVACGQDPLTRRSGDTCSEVSPSVYFGEVLRHPLHSACAAHPLSRPHEVAPAKTQFPRAATGLSTGTRCFPDTRPHSWELPLPFALRSR